MVPDAPPPRGFRRGHLVGLLVLLTLALWAPHVPGSDYSFDDREGVLESPVINGARPALDAFDADYWAHRGGAGHFRPIAQLSLALDHRVAVALGGAEGRAWVFRTANLIWFTLVVAFAGLLAGRWFDGRGFVAACAGLALFAAHPVNADVVAWISARSSTLALLPGVVLAWGLAGSAAPSKARTLGCVFGATLLGLLAKEDGYISGLLVVAVAVCPPRREASVVQATGADPASHPGPRRHLNTAVAALLLGLAFALTLRHHALGAWFPSAPFAPLAGLPLGERLLAGAAVCFEALATVFVPLKSVPLDRSLAQELVGHGVTRGAVVGGLALVGMLAVGLWARRTRAGLLLLLAVAAWLPYTQVVPAGELFAPRFLFAPLLFVVLAVGARALPLSARSFMVWVLVFALLATRVPRAAQVYDSRMSFEAAVLEGNPDDARAWNGIGVAHLEAGDDGAAEAAFERAIELDPTYGRPHSNLGGLAFGRGDYDTAGWHFELATQLGPGNPVAHANLGAYHLRERHPRQAFEAYLRALALAPGMGVAWRGVGRAKLMLADLEGAEADLERALELMPGDASTLELLAKARGEVPNDLVVEPDPVDGQRSLDLLRASLASPEARTEMLRMAEELRAAEGE